MCQASHVRAPATRARGQAPARLLRRGGLVATLFAALFGCCLLLGGGGGLGLCRGLLLEQGGPLALGFLGVEFGFRILGSGGSLLLLLSQADIERPERKSETAKR